MKILDIEQFGYDLKEVLALNHGKISPQKWQTFLDTYFTNELARDINEQIKVDLDFFRKNDPASGNYTWYQILSVRRGMIAIVAHRIFQKMLAFNPDLVFEIEVLAKSVQVATNVEIHPQAQLGNNFAVDHGHGTIVGATTITGNFIFIYHGVTLGATGNLSKHDRRHPKLGNNIFLGNGAQILGPSVLEDNIHISSESMILDSYIESNVVISPGVIVSKVRVPQGCHIFGYDPKTRKYVTRHANKKETELVGFERINVSVFE